MSRDELNTEGGGGGDLGEVTITGGLYDAYGGADLYGGGDAGQVQDEPGFGQSPPGTPTSDEPTPAPDDPEVIAEVPVTQRRTPPAPTIPIYYGFAETNPVFGMLALAGPKPAPKPKPAPRPRRTPPKPSRTRPQRPQSPPKPPVRYTPRPVPGLPTRAPGLLGRLLTPFLRALSLPLTLLTYSAPAGPSDEYPGRDPMFPGFGPRGETNVNDRPSVISHTGAGVSGGQGPLEGLGTVVISSRVERSAPSLGIQIGAGFVSPYLDLVSAPVALNVPAPRPITSVSEAPERSARTDPRSSISRSAQPSALTPSPVWAPGMAPLPQLPLPRPRPSPTPRPTTPTLPIGPQPLPTPGPDPSKVRCTCRPVNNKPKKKRKPKPPAPEPIEMEFEVTSKTLGKVKVEGKVGKFCYQPNKLRKKICL